MRLILENWRKYINKQQLFEEVQEIYVLYENDLITEAEFLKKLKAFGLPMAAAVSLAAGAGAAASAQTKDAWADYEQAAQSMQAEERPGRTYDIQQDFKLISAPAGVRPDFVYVPPEQIPDDADLGPNSAYSNAAEYRKAVETNSLELLKNQLVGKGSGAIFGGGVGSALEFEKTKDGKSILPLTWSLSYEAFLNKFEEESK